MKDGRAGAGPTKRTGRSLAALGALLVLLAGPSKRAAAQDSAGASTTEDAEAPALFEAGRIAFADGRFADANGHFRRAHQLSGRAGLLFNIGQTEDRLRHEAEALAAFEAFVQQVPDAPNRREVEGRIRVLREAVAEEAAAGARAAEQAQSREEALRQDAARQLAAREDELRGEAAQREDEAHRRAAAATQEADAARRAAETAEAGRAAAERAAADAEARARSSTVSVVRTSDGEDAASVAVVDPLAASAPTAASSGGGIESQWWFWTILGAAAAGGVTTAVLLSSGGVTYTAYTPGETGVVLTLTGTMP